MILLNFPPPILLGNLNLMLSDLKKKEAILFTESLRYSSELAITKKAKGTDNDQ